MIEKSDPSELRDDQAGIILMRINVIESNKLNESINQIIQKPV